VKLWKTSNKILITGGRHVSIPYIEQTLS